MSQYSVPYGGERIRFTVRTQPQRPPYRIAIHVEPDGRVPVDVPPNKNAKSRLGDLADQLLDSPARGFET